MSAEAEYLKAQGYSDEEIEALLDSYIAAHEANHPWSAVPAQSAPTQCQCGHSRADHLEYPWLDCMADGGACQCAQYKSKPIPPTSAPFDMKFSEKFLREAGEAEDGVIWPHPGQREPESRPQQDAPIPERNKPRCFDCNKVGMSHCAHPEECGNVYYPESHVRKLEAALTQAREALDIYMSHTDDDENGMQLFDFIMRLRAALAATQPSVKTNPTNQDGEKPQE